MIVIVDYGMGNLHSVYNAFLTLGKETLLTSEPKHLEEASAIVLPGVGAFGKGMKNLSERGLIEALNREVIEKGKPYLGICLGMQFLARESCELGDYEGLGWIDGIVKRIEPNNSKFKVPHMGWNNVEILKPTPLFDGIEEEPVFYFVHSYFIEVNSEYSDIVNAICWHGITITAGIQRDNIYAIQFHPEKSQKSGLKLLENFIKLI